MKKPAQSGTGPGVWTPVSDHSHALCHSYRTSPSFHVHSFPSVLPFTFFLFSILIHFSTYFLSFSIFHLFTSLYLSCHTHPCTEIIPSLREHFLRVVCFMFVPLIFLLPLSPSSPPFTSFPFHPRFPSLPFLPC